MRQNSAKRKMLQGGPAFGYSAGSGSYRVVETLSRCGIDFLLIDNQHGSWGPDSTIAALAAAEGGTATPMARVARNDYTMIGRLLDEGVLGLVVPMVDTVELAQAAAEACRFPPAGKRSWGYGRAAALGDDYTDHINDEFFLAIQLESAQAVENAEAIMAVHGVDGCWVGPADLALSMGVHPRDMYKHEGHQRALERVVTACRNTGKIAGLSTSGPEEAVRRVTQGFQFLTAGGDLGFMLAGAAEGLKTMGLK